MEEWVNERIDEWMCEWMVDEWMSRQTQGPTIFPELDKALDF